MKRTFAFILLALAVAVSTARAALIPVTQDIAAGTSVTWTANNVYLLETVVYVHDGATLTIEPGTVVRGKRDVTIARQGIPQLVSALWVARGGKLIANGTRENPIIFTSENDPLDGSIPPTQTALWGGVVIMGKAAINTSKHAVGNVSTPKFDKYEGCQDDPGTGLPYPEHTFGGSDDNDNSGSLRYVSIRHCGLNFQQDAELNCLTMGGVGSGTTLEYVEVYAGSDDGFEWWGGTVNSKYLVASFIEDDNFDVDQGYRGQNQFWFGLKSPASAATADSRGIEADGDLNQNVFDETPLNQWSASNVTLIGRGKTVTQTDRNVAWNTRDEDVPNVFNSIFAEWNQGLLLDNDGVYHHNTTMLAHIRNNIWDVTTASRNANGNPIFNTASYFNTVESAMLGGISYANDGVLDPRPTRNSPAYQNVLAGAPVAVNYRGAFSGPSDNWADGWTALSRYGYLKAATGTPTPNQPTLTIALNGANAEVSFPTQTGFTYQLQSMTDVAGTTWGTEGAAVAGTGSAVTIPVAASGDAKFLRVRVN